MSYDVLGLIEETFDLECTDNILYHFWTFLNRAQLFEHPNEIINIPIVGLARQQVVQFH